MILVYTCFGMGDIVMASAVINRLIQSNIPYLWVTEEIGKQIYPKLNIVTYSRGPGMFDRLKEIREKYVYTELLLTCPSWNREGAFLNKEGVRVFCNSPEEEANFRLKYHTVDINNDLVTSFMNYLSTWGCCGGAELKPQYINPYDRMEILSNDILFHVAPQSSGWAHKAFPPGLFLKIMKYLTEKGYNCIMIGDSGQSFYAKLFSQYVRDFTDVPIQQTIFMMNKSICLISNDCGPAHLASAMELPTITFWGPTSPERTGPFPIQSEMNKMIVGKVPCGPCFPGDGLSNCRKPICHEQVSFNDFLKVWESVSWK